MQAFGQTVSPVEHLVHFPSMQAAPEAHWVLSVQLVRQAVAPQMKAPQEIGCPGKHDPPPLHAPAGVVVPFAHEELPQLVWESG
jgi:hypothetical protein